MKVDIITCLNCRTPVKPRKVVEYTKKTHNAAISFIPFLMCCLPYVLDKYRKVRWECPVCEVLISPLNESKQFECNN